MGIFVKEKDIGLIWDQNELSSQKGSWEIKNIGAIYSAAIAALRHERCCVKKKLSMTQQQLLVLGRCNLKRLQDNSGKCKAQVKTWGSKG